MGAWVHLVYRFELCVEGSMEGTDETLLPVGYGYQPENRKSFGALNPKDPRNNSVYLYVPEGTVPEKYCRRCGREETWQWRRGPDGSSSLCNACGQRYAKMVEREHQNPVKRPRERITVGELVW